MIIHTGQADEIIAKYHEPDVEFRLGPVQDGFLWLYFGHTEYYKICLDSHKAMETDHQPESSIWGFLEIAEDETPPWEST